MSHSKWYYGTRDGLLDSDAAAGYMFDQLGDNKKSRTGPTDCGDKFYLERNNNGRFRLLIWTFDCPQQPFGLSKVDPYKTDISKILERISAPR